MHRNLSDAQVQLCINRYVKDECKTTHTINLNIGYNGIYKNENNFFGKINAISIGLSHEFQKRNLWSVKFKYTNLGFAANTQTGITNTYSCEKYTTNDSLSQQHLLSAAIGLMNYIANNQSVLMALSDGMLGKMGNQNTTIMHYEEGELKEIKETYSNSTYDVCVGSEAMYEYHIKYKPVYRNRTLWWLYDG